MRSPLPHALEMARCVDGRLATTKDDGPNGLFYLRRERGPKTELRIIASDGLGWEHVSVSTATRCPTWDEMCLVKDLFWSEDEAVMQLHPPKTEYVNNHAFCLHLWRPMDGSIPLPPAELVGVKTREAKPLTLMQAAILSALYA